MIISARPCPDIKVLFSQGTSSNVNDMSFYHLGRNALLSGLIALGLQKGDSIIVPAYMCDSTIKPIQVYGFKVVLIDVDKNLALPLNKIREVLKKNNSIKALLAVHYFGMTQDINELISACQEYGVKVVEDASHSFMSQLLRNKDSLKGDAEIFSMRKTLPIVDGGVLRINQNGFNERNNRDTQCVSIISDVRCLLLRILETIVTSLGINIYGQSINNIKIKLQSKNNNQACDFSAKSCQASWQLGKYLNNEKYLQNAQQNIVNNFNHLSQALQNLGFRLLVESVEENVVPQAFIIYDDKGGLVDYLRSKGVGAWRWPDEEMLEEIDQNPTQYPNAVFFDERLVLIPIHQSLGDKQINYIIQVLSRWQL